MECPICADFSGSEASVAAHICGRHDPDHQPYVGLKDDGSPLTRAEHESESESNVESDESNGPFSVPSGAGDDRREESDESDESGDLGVLLAGAFGLRAANRLNDDDDRGTI